MRSRTTAANALESVLNGMETGTRIRESLALAYWDRVVGPQAAAATEPDAVRQGVLFVRTKSSSWSQELSFLKARIITELNKTIGRPVIREIVFRAQGISKQPPEQTPEHPTPDEIAKVKLTDSEAEALDRDLKSIAEIPDARIREAALRHAVRTRKLRRWRLNHGWLECHVCGAVYSDPGPTCPLCRLHC
jgi:predicted nucleic acid-binding Zn ribbon protein